MSLTSETTDIHRRTIGLGNMPFCVDVSFIETMREKPMKIHTDLNHSAARKHHADGKELPYTIDLPMSGDGIRIGIYGDDPLDTTEMFDEAITTQSSVKL